MATPIGHKTVPARIMVDLEDGPTQLATLDLRVPVHAKPGQRYTNDDGQLCVALTLQVKDDAVLVALREALRGRIENA